MQTMLCFWVAKCLSPISTGDNEKFCTYKQSLALDSWKDAAVIEVGVAYSDISCLEFLSDESFKPYCGQIASEIEYYTHPLG